MVGAACAAQPPTARFPHAKARTIKAPMSLINLTELRGRLARDQRLLGIDPGRKRIGLALSDVRLVVASPYGTLPRAKLSRNAEEIAAIVRREGVGGFVVGFPLDMDGSFGPAAQAVRDWTRDLCAATALPATLWDERLSSAATNRMLIEDADLSRAKRAEVVDRASAAWILQAALDASRPNPFV